MRFFSAFVETPLHTGDSQRKFPLKCDSIDQSKIFLAVASALRLEMAMAFAVISAVKEVE